MIVHHLILKIARITYLILGEVQLLKLTEDLDHQKKKFSINFAKANTKFCLSLHYNEDNSYLFVNGREILKFKANNKNVNFPTQFCLRIISSGFRASQSTEVSLSGNVYDFSVDYSSTDKCDVLHIRIYLMVKNNI